MPGAMLEAALGNLAVAAALAVAALALGRRTRRPALAHAAWLLVLVKLVTPPLFPIPFPCLPVAPATVRTDGPVPVAALPRPEGPAPAMPAEKPGPAPVAPPLAAAPRGAPWPALPAASATAAAGWPRWDVLLLGAWAAGSAVWVAASVRRVRQFSRLLRFAGSPPEALAAEVADVASRVGLRRPPRVRVLPGGVPPFVWSAGRPTLYFPEDLLGRVPAEGLRTLVAHELAHLRRWDHAVRWVEFAALAAYWWCPLAWLARRELRRLEEEACDAEVVGALPGSAHAYASAVLETLDFLAGAARVPALASAIGHAGPLRRRLVLILDGRRPARPGAAARLTLLAAGLTLLAAGPKLERLAAAAVEAGTTIVAGASAPEELPAEGADAGATQYLPSPERLFAADGTAPCLAAALSPDGRRLALACGPDVAVWDVAARRQLFTLAGHTDTVNAVAWSPDGARLATAGDDGLARLWDAADGRGLFALAGHASWVTALAFAPDGRKLATGGYDRVVRLWDVASGAPRGAWVGHAGGVRALAFAPDGRSLASGAADSAVRVWDVDRGAARWALTRHAAAVRAVAFAPDGLRLATASEDRTLRLWDAADGREALPPVPLPDHGTALAFAPGGRALVAGTIGGHLLNVDPASGQPRRFLGVEPGEPAGRPAHGGAVAAVLAVPRAGGALYTVAQDRAVLAWAPAGPPRPAPPAYRAGGGPVAAVALSPDGRTLAAAGRDGVIRLWEVGAAAARATLPGHPGGVTALAFAGPGRLVSAGADERVRAWDLATGRESATLVRATDDLRVALAPDGHTLAVVGGRAPGVALWDLATGGRARYFGGSAGCATAAAFTPDGTRLATGHADGMVRLWDPATGEEVQRGPAGRGRVDALAFAPGGRNAAVVVNATAGPDADPDAGPGHAVVFWDAAAGVALAAPEPLAHPGPVTAAAFTPGGGRLLTAGRDGNLYVWDVGSGRVAGTIRGHDGPVRAVALAPDGTAVFSAGDRAARRWPLPAGRAPPPPNREALP